ncbi:glycosyltransferase family 4 protein [Halomonas lysinitropha]|uniref:Alpha-D-kanosaminyltransferase n=1 Tax=Halomonas lysinitropha TaxID=2607506 RepID=A0A5K1I1F8_9GAMM|nr:glycosyltransferase family 4 protein [Halomonas lysinitropha]VVZ94211.1 Alpha-D-kanosaminyltransferase [Halomonas lysinitropha]
MRVTHVNLARGFRGGERQTELLIRALAEEPRIHQQLVCREDSPMRKHLSDVPGLSLITANHQLGGHRCLGPTDLVHAHEAKGVHWAWLHHRLTGTPYVITRRVDTPVQDKALNRLCYRQAACRVAISRLIQTQLEARGWGSVERIPSAHAGLSADPEKTASWRAAYPGKFLVGHAGALVDRHKGQRVLLKAARRLAREAPEVHFLFLGDGADAQALRQESADLTNVEWLGFKENIADYIAGLDAFAFPSRNEGLGSVLLDVMQLEVPIIASRVGGIPDIIEHETTGLLFPSGDTDALADGLLRIKAEPHLRRRLCRQARERLEDYSPRAMAAAYMRLYQQLVDHRYQETSR